jgi:peptidyl-prolyl cis-trans isomerase D
LRGADAQKSADSLVAILKANPAQWDSLNQKFNTDESAKIKGGDLSYQAQGTFVAPFNDLIFYKAKQGEFNTVASQFGVHIVQVTGIKVGSNESRVKVAYVREPIIPSSETDKKASIAADELLTSSKNLEELRKNAQAKGIQIQPASGFRANDMTLGSFGQADGVRQMIRWAYEAKPGERAKNTYALREQGEGYNSKYVVAAMKSIVPKGTPSVKDLKEQLTPFVKNRKKGEVLKSKINTEDLNALVSQYNTKVDTARGVTFNATFVPNLGSEPRVVGAAFTTEAGKTTKPVVGEGGVYVLKITNKTTIDNSPVQKDQLRLQLIAPIKNAIRGTLSRNLRKNEGVTDNRSKFF